MALAVPSDDSINKELLWSQRSVFKLLIPAVFVKETDAEFDQVREQVRREVRLLKDKTGVAAEECLKLQAEINQLVVGIADVVAQMLESCNEARPALPTTRWSLWHLVLAAYAGLSLGYWL